MGSKKENKWKQIGNYLLGIERGAKGSYLVCKTTAGNWSVRWREDTMMYGLMMSMIKEEASASYLHALLTLMYSATTYPHDLVSLVNKMEMPVIDGFIKLINAQSEYEASISEHPTDEEDAKTIEEMKQMSEMGQMLNDEFEKKEGGDA